MARGTEATVKIRRVLRNCVAPLRFICRPRPATPECLLNFDILAAVFPFISHRADVLALMYTCKFLLASGIPTLLSQVTLLSCADIMSFSSFMLVDLPRRASLLRELRLLAPACRSESCTAEPLVPGQDVLPDGASEYPREYPGAHAFASRFIFKILQHADRLTHFHVEYLEDWLHCEPQLILAGSRFKHLRALTVGIQRYREERAEIFLQAISSHITRVNINYHVWLDVFTTMDGFPLINSLPDSLETLSLDNGRPKIAAKQYPNVRTLTMSGWQFAHADILCHTFPNLVEFRCHDALFLNSSNLRPENQLYFTNQDDWSELQILRGSTCNLHALGFSRPVTVLDVVGGKDIDLTYFARVCNDATPLCLRYSTNTWAMCQRPEFYRLSRETAAHIAELHIRLSPHTVSGVPRCHDKDARTLLAFVQSFPRLARLCFSMTFNIPHDPTISDVETWSAFCAAMVASHSSATLQWLALEIPDVPLSFWSVHPATGDGKPQVESVSQEVGSQGWQLDAGSWYESGSS